MRNTFKNICAVLITVFMSFNLNATKPGYNIEIQVKGLTQSQLILAHYFGSSVYPDDTVTLNSDGYGVFSGKEALPQGVYMIYFDNGSSFQILLGEKQHFSLKTDTVDYVENLKVSGSLENEIFTDFLQFMADIKTKLKTQQSKINDSISDNERQEIIKVIDELGNKRIERIDDICRKYPELYVSTFLKATLDVIIPKDIPSDAASRYIYYKNNYFNNFNLSDVRLVYSPLFDDKISTYLNKVIVQSPDSLILAIDMIIEKSRVDSIYYMYVVRTLFNKYSKNKYMGIDAVLVHIAEKYYLNDSWWSDEKFIANLEERVSILKPLLIGKTAPDIELRYVPDEHFIKANADSVLKRYPHAGSFFTINDIDADFTILSFWEASCGHCKKEIPKLHQLFNDTLSTMGVKVVSISTLFGEDGKEKWVDFVNKNKLYGWINAWNPYDYKFKTVYDIRSAPQIYILNKEKEIIGKKLGIDQIVDFIEMYKKSRDT